jgi:nitrate reductase NapE component
MAATTGMSELPELSPKERRARNWLVFLFVSLAVFASVILVCSVLSRIFPDSGIPFLFIAFQIGPQPIPLP